MCALPLTVHVILGSASNPQSLTCQLQYCCKPQTGSVYMSFVPNVDAERENYCKCRIEKATISVFFLGTKVINLSKCLVQAYLQIYKCEDVSFVECLYQGKASN